MGEYIYPGVSNDKFAGMTGTGKIIRDAWIFGLIPETETCEGWTMSRLDVLHHQVNDEWDKYGVMVSSLPPELFERHQRIYKEAVDQAKAVGWSADIETEDEE